MVLHSHQLQYILGHYCFDLSNEIVFQKLIYQQIHVQVIFNLVERE